jgi:hypothetical protein
MPRISYLKACHLPFYLPFLLLTFFLGINRRTRRLLKVHLRLGWVKLHHYYKLFTFIAYSGAVIMNPFKKFTHLETLWQQLPPRLGDDYLNDSKRRLKRLWLKHYKSRQAEETPTSTSTANFKDYTMLRMQFANAISL